MLLFLVIAIRSLDYRQASVTSSNYYAHRRVHKCCSESDSKRGKLRHLRVGTKNKIEGKDLHVIQRVFDLEIRRQFESTWWCFGGYFEVLGPSLTRRLPYFRLYTHVCEHALFSPFVWRIYDLL